MSGRRPGSHHWRQLSPLARVAYITCTVVAVAVVLASLGAYAIYRTDFGNIAWSRSTG